MMTFLADENVDKQIVERLREENYEVIYIAEISPSISDDHVLNLANENDAVLITADKDFGELVFRRRLIHNGVILIRMERFTPEIRSRIITEIILTNEEIIRNSFTVISNRGFRVRRREN